ncbi:helix-turn-helix domain-containing protein [Microbacterium maritypicum]|uniref:Helix-turn-helix domain-containing protein n=1 Tax=Microbacterium maritypicum TaxID=33918 RepID=A0ACD4B3Y0_MICMQ|nr:helix-turn-helix transcriptional regulator [Microbacterium liquefaciens]UTT52311.1 helix-turn-helix domain-containing protein [Microbacterium liquefaciens]
MALDEQIGENLTKLRGEMSQKDLATAMRGRGWKWSQATVWSIEKGERPLRLAEAVDVAWILDERLDALLRAGSDHDVEQILSAPKRSLESVLDALVEHAGDFGRSAAKIRDLGLPVTAWGARSKLADALDGFESARAAAQESLERQENVMAVAEDELWTAIRTGYMGRDEADSEGVSNDTPSPDRGSEIPVRAEMAPGKRKAKAKQT